MNYVLVIPWFQRNQLMLQINKCNKAEFLWLLSTFWRRNFRSLELNCSFPCTYNKRNSMKGKRFSMTPKSGKVHLLDGLVNILARKRESYIVTIYFIISCYINRKKFLKNSFFVFHYMSSSIYIYMGELKLFICGSWYFFSCLFTFWGLI